MNRIAARVSLRWPGRVRRVSLMLLKAIPPSERPGHGGQLVQLADELVEARLRTDLPLDHQREDRLRLHLEVGAGPREPRRRVVVDVLRLGGVVRLRAELAV